MFKVHKPKPRDLPVFWSSTILMESMCPYFSKTPLNSRSVVYKLSPKTPRHLLGVGFNLSPWYFLSPMCLCL